MAGNIIANQTLHAVEGKKYKENGEAVGYYAVTRKSPSSIVFLPKGAVPGKDVRVDLQELEKKDVRGYPMYRATPATAIVSERWRENSDKTLSRVKISTDWLGLEREVDIVETRPPKSWESETGTRSEFVPIWGIGLATSSVEERPLKVFKAYEERVESGTLTSREVSERIESQPTAKRPVAELAHEHWTGDWWRNHLEVDWSKLTTHLTFFAVCSDCKKGQAWTGPYLQAPAFWRIEVEARYPICPCGRKRRDMQVADGYDKCETCRAEDTCSRCSKKTKVAVTHGALVCDACKPWQEAEAKINAGLTVDHKAAIAAEAKRLRAGETYPQSDGEALLRALTTHFADSARRDSFLRRCADYHWHYWTEAGVFGTKFSPEALMLLEYLPQASGNGLVDMLAWHENHVRVPSGLSDYYVKSQLEGQTEYLTPFGGTSVEWWCSTIKEKLEAGKPVLADFLRGNEEDRHAVLEAKQWLEAQQSIDSEVWQTLRHVENVLEENQDYTSALTVLAEYKRGWERRKEKFAVEQERERARELVRAREQEWLSEDERPHFALTTPPPTPRDEYLARRRELEAQHRHQHFGVYGPFARTVRPSKKDPRRLVWSYVDKDGNILDADPASRLMVEAKTTYLGWISGNVPISAKEKAAQIRLEMKAEPDFEVKK